MRTLPVDAQLYLYLFAIYLAALLITGWAAVIPLPDIRAHGWEVIVFVVLTIHAYGKKIVLMRHTSDKNSGSMSLGFAITFTALRRLWPQGALVVRSLGCLSSCLYPHRQRGFQVAFNMAVAGLSSWLAGIIFLSLNGGNLVLDLRGTATAVGAASLVYYGINSAATVAAIGLCTHQKIIAFWRENFLWTAPSYFAEAAIGTLGALACDSGNWLMLLVIVPTAFLNLSVGLKKW